MYVVYEQIRIIFVAILEDTGVMIEVFTLFHEVFSAQPLNSANKEIKAGEFSLKERKLGLI